MTIPEISLLLKGSSVNTEESHTSGGPAKMQSRSPLAVLPVTIEVTQQPAGQNEIAHLQQLYTAESWEEIIEFLTGHPDLAPLLLEANPRLHDMFAGSQSVQLRLVPGYEEDEPTLLFADIVTTADPMLAFTQMNRFEDEWWLDAMTPSRGLLHFSVEFA